MDVKILQTYASMGWPLFPCSNRDKSPLVAGGFKSATTDINQLTTWHQRFPDCAWAVATSAERGVVDIDPRHGGDATLTALEAQHGPLPPTPRVKTGGGGWHYYLKFHPGTRSGKDVYGPGIDRKTEGGYVIIPRSRIDIPEHEGRAYEWETRPWEATIADCPAWLVEVKPTPKPATEHQKETDPWVVREAEGDDLLTHQGSPEGERRRTLCRLVGIHLARGDSEQSVMAMAEAWADRCRPPFTDWHKHTSGLMARDEAKGIRLTTPITSSPSRIKPSLIVEYKDDSVVPPEESGKELTNSGGRETEPEPGEVSSFLPPSPEQTSAEGKRELVPSFLASASSELNGSGGLVLSSIERPALPPLHPDAYHGLLGQILETIGPELEGSSVPFGFCLLTAFGNAVGTGPHVNLGSGGIHRTNLYAVVVGTSGVGKSEPWTAASWLMERADPLWPGTCVMHGLGSGEGLVDRVRDEMRLMKWNRKSGVMEEEVIPGASEKRCFALETEFGRVLTLCRRDGSTLAQNLCNGWDGKTLEVANRGANKLLANGHHVSVWGNITDAELHKRMSDSLEAVNGFGNRFLWLRQARRDYLDMGGDLNVLTPFVEPLAGAITSARGAGLITFDAEARVMWQIAYRPLCDVMETMPALGRARGHALRLVLLYALLDGSTVIKAEHVRAGLAAWAWAEASARTIFTGQSETVAVPDPLWLRLLNLITSQPGIRRSELLRAVREPAETVGEALAKLEASGMAHPSLEQNPKGGPRGERWWPGTKPSGGGCTDDNTTTTITHEDADAWTVRVDDMQSEAGKEGTNYPSESVLAVVGGENNGKEGTNSPPTAPPELVSSFPTPTDSTVVDAENARKEGTNYPDPEPELVSSFPTPTDADRAIGESEFLEALTGDSGHEVKSNVNKVVVNGVVNDKPKPTIHETLQKWAKACNEFMDAHPEEMYIPPNDPPTMRYDVDHRGRSVRRTTLDTKVNLETLTVKKLLEMTWLIKPTPDGFELISPPVELIDWARDHHGEIMAELAVIKAAEAEEDAKTAAFLAKLDAADMEM